MERELLGISNAYELLSRLKESGVEVSIPVDLNKILDFLKISVEHDFELEREDVIGEISFSDKQAVIRLNPHQNAYKVRERFTIAHEIGHYCLHSSSNRDGFQDSRKTMSRTDSYWDKFESEANNFAAMLLMPKYLIQQEGKKIIAQYKKDESKNTMPVKEFVSRMSSLFEVSSKAMEYRLTKLGVTRSR